MPKSLTREELRKAASTSPYEQRVFLRSEDPADTELSECSLALARDLRLEHLIVESKDGLKMANSEPAATPVAAPKTAQHVEQQPEVIPEFHSDGSMSVKFAETAPQDDFYQHVVIDKKNRTISYERRW